MWGKMMKLWQTKPWTPWDIGLLKWAVFVFGMMIGAYIPEWVLTNRWLLTVLFVLFLTRPVYAYWFKKD